ncbi:hypothetical protein F5Y06DRAFT_276867 [Hypoxylon sp. FL0890]|nr:hypothetical protein F5Y06DRAFT_276867 [Hypoxylon sp. FL0890]
MSGLEALSVACNIMQVISFAHETISFCKEIYQGRSPDDHVEQNAASLLALSAQLQTHYESTKPKTSQETQLADIAKQCNIAARALEEEVKFLVSHHATGRLAQTLCLAVKTNWRRRRLERLEKSLRNYQHTMESHLLARICKKTDAIELQQQQGFEQLGRDIQLFVSQYASGHTKLAQLVKTELTSIKASTAKENVRSEECIKQHVSSKMLTAEKSITSHVTKETNKVVERVTQVTADSNMRASTEKQRDQLLRSLRFPAMNERKNNLADSHEKTFHWVFDTCEILEDNQSDSDGDTSDSSRATVSDDDSDYSSEDDDDDDDDDKYIPWDNFSDWLKSDSSIYWISGKPGSGKSTLMKYIIENPLTKSALEIWRANPVVLSHFFWKPGSKMQNSIKGFLCSILHQALRLNTNVLDSILASFDFLLLKESDTDWSVKELKDMCFTVLSSSPSPLCIFIDGLDEVCEEDGQLSLLKLVDDLRKLASVKICVASRPEPLLQSALFRHQQLRLQDLTENDMREYADAHIRPYVIQDRISRIDGYFIVDSLVSKAEGVFLWLHLAAHSLIRGFENGDTIEEVRQRLDEMPSELSKLYSDMWTRMNEDTKVYRENAACYFNLVITSRTIQDRDPIWGRPLSLFSFMATIEPDVQDAFINKKTPMDAMSLQHLCNKTRKAVQIRCAGLLEISESAQRKHLRGLYPKGRSEIRFIHRTAYDFLTDTDEGYRIRTHDSSSPDTLYIQLAKGKFVEVMAFQNPSLGKILTPLSFVTDSNLQAITHDLLRKLWDWYDKGRGLSRRYQATTYISPGFLALAAFPEFKDFILSSIAVSPDPSSLATDVLRDLLYYGFYRCGLKESIIAIRCFIRPLLSLNADLKAKGIVSREFLYPSPRRQARFSSPFGAFIEYFFHEFPFLDIEYFKARYDWLQIFMETQLNLEERVPVFVSITVRQGLPFLRVESLRVYDGFVDEAVESISSDTGYDVLLDLGVRLLVEIMHEGARKANISQQSSTRSPNEMLETNLRGRDSSNNPSARIALLFPPRQRVEYLDHRANSYKSAGGRATRQLLALLTQFLFDGNSRELACEVWEQMTEILDDIRNGSTEFEEVHMSPWEFLAEQKCGYCFVDEAGEREGESGNDWNDDEDDKDSRN